MPDYRWEPGVSATGRYRNLKNGRFVPQRVVRSELDAYLLSSHEPVVALQDALRSKSISIIDWELAMREQVKLVNLNAVAQSVGGYENMTAADYGRAGQIIKEQYGYLKQFAYDIADGKQKLDGTLTRRVNMYIDAARGAYYTSVTESVKNFDGDITSGVLSAAMLKLVNDAIKQNGITHITSKLNPADHCIECVALDGRWYEIGHPAYNPPGFRICRKNCKCSEVYGVEVNGEIIEIGAA